MFDSVEPNVLLPDFALNRDSAQCCSPLSSNTITKSDTDIMFCLSVVDGTILC